MRSVVDTNVNCEREARYRKQEAGLRKAVGRPPGLVGAQPGSGHRDDGARLCPPAADRTFAAAAGVGASGRTGHRTYAAQARRG